MKTSFGRRYYIFTAKPLNFRQIRDEVMHVVDVGNELSNIVGTRDSIRKLEIKDNTVLDFKNVEFISRAAAHELLKTCSGSVKFINMNKSVRKMLSLVKKSLSSSSYEEKNVQEVIF